MVVFGLGMVSSEDCIVEVLGLIVVGLKPEFEMGMCRWGVFGVWILSRCGVAEFFLRGGVLTKFRSWSMCGRT